MSLKHRLQGFVAAVVVAASLIQVGLILERYMDESREEVQEQIDWQVIKLQQQLGEWLESRAQLVRHSAELLALQAVEPEIYQLIARAGEMDAFYSGFADGRLVWDKLDLPVPAIDPRERPWYQLAQRHGGLVITEPYQDVGGQMVISMAQPFEGYEQGVVAADLTIGGRTQSLVAQMPQEQGSLLLVDDRGRVLAARDQRLLLQPLTQVLPQWTELGQGQAGELVEVQFNGQAHYVGSGSIALADWRVLVLYNKAYAELGMKAMVQRSVLLILGLILLFALLTAVLLNTLFKPVEQLESAIDELAQGDGDLTRRLPIVREDEIGRVADRLNGFVADLAAMVSAIGARSEQLLSHSQSNRGQAQEQGLAVARQHQRLDQIAAAVAQLAAAANEVAVGAGATASAAQSASNACQSGEAVIARSSEVSDRLAKQVEESALVIGQLETHAQQIDQVLVTIENIAEQTNLLALNAAIEAARAGEKGRGFAVVADEVRVLSQRTSNSTDEIRQMIESLQAISQEAVAEMDKGRALARSSAEEAHLAEESLGVIAGAISEIAAMSTQIATAAEQQRAVSVELSGNSADIRDDSLSLARLGEQLQATSNEMEQDSLALQQQVERFKI
ncbi:methyl-accepting chemotaxis protein [Ferrimonas pelagia]|uniref:Methyl-accepting chemotaxis protein n=1 Tax=Ferrimonas pelagia TaxID=1177826 RepID=A0ABP9EQH8_9GAMM